MHEWKYKPRHFSLRFCDPIALVIVHQVSYEASELGKR